MKKARLGILVSVIILGLGATGVAWDDPMGTAFTYQGHLKRDGMPYSGSGDFIFTLWVTDDGVMQVGPTLTKDNVLVHTGLFTVELDFGTDIFTGDARWLEIEVYCPGDLEYTTLSPRRN